ncbi:tetratricopeptide repeat protein [Iningainema tapete]|uniref:Tetratricopeptide repeat protein n=1 Tax=Iningainema tapete BLCC-T55 TaxID=2748662 RepID=A0A8J6XU71_9CYAN|nr:tetratricopeptide repeat protein [Iningainema tapete]MBD2777696.1 tetratricopeptide repeat protein [Iningainema tapete BLCC-T55]
MKKLIGIILSLLLLFGWGKAVMAAESSNITPEQLRQRDELATQAFAATNKGDFATAEQLWTEILEQFPDNAAVWSNRGNSRVSQNKLVEALADYNKAVELAPNVTDPYLNRGTALEGLGRWEDAIADYNHVLELDPKDAMAYNNRGNAQAGLGKWEEAIADYKKSADTAPNFAFARANYALALYQIGKTDEAIRQMRNITRKYPNFADVRAALTAAYWVQGKIGEAESNWVSAVGLDGRYKDINWVKNTRRWPPSMVTALDKFLTLK